MSEAAPTLGTDVFMEFCEALSKECVSRKVKDADLLWAMRGEGRLIQKFASMIKNDAEYIDHRGYGTQLLKGYNPFVARTHFRQKNFWEKGVKISWIDKNFREWFSDKLEYASRSAISYSVVRRQTIFNQDVLAELGGEKHMELSLAEIYHYLLEIKSLEEGRTVIAYAKDTTGVLRAIYATYHKRGYMIQAREIEGSPMNVDDLVITRCQF